MQAYNPDIFEVHADFKLKASLGYTSRPHHKEKERKRGDAEGPTHKENVTVWWQGHRQRQGIYTPRSREAGGPEEMGEEPEVGPAEGPTQPTPC